MHLNHDCVREILIEIEKLEYNHYLTLNDFVNNISFSSYSPKEILYSVEKLDEAGFINVRILKDLSGYSNFFIFSLTWEGHEFLDNIRNKDVWQDVKSSIEKVGSVSLDIVAELAKSFLLKKFGLS